MMRSNSNRNILLVLLVAAACQLLVGNVAEATILATGTESMCCMCGECRTILFGRATTPLTSSGDTCMSLAMDMARGDFGAPTNGKCTSMQAKYRSSCCDKNYSPPQVLQTRSATPGQGNGGYDQGPEPPCDICPDKSFPRHPNTVTAILYVPGNPTCEDLYYMGKTGNFPDRLCNPAQDYFQAPCGCPKH